MNMKKLFGKIIPLCVLLGALFSEGIFYLLLRQFLNPFFSIILALLPFLPFLIYGAARKQKPGKMRRMCNLIGGALITPACYFMIFSASAGLFVLFGLPLSYASDCVWAILISCLAVTLAGLYQGTRIQTRRYAVNIPHAMPCKIVLFSDLHLGDFCTLKQVERTVKAIENEKSALILFAGDLVDMDLPTGKKAEQYAKLLSRLGGIVACEGNHDLHDKDNPARESFLQRANIRMLCDESTHDPETGLWISGRKSRKRQRLTANALAKKGADILLEHDPKTVEEALPCGYGLILCGHTHRGQTFPGNILRRLTCRYYYGMNNEGDTTVITTGGCGSTALPLRLGIPPEIVVITVENDK